MNRRDFLHTLAAAAAAGLPLDAKAALDLSAGAAFYDGVERFGNVTLPDADVIAAVDYMVAAGK